MGHRTASKENAVRALELVLDVRDNPRPFKIQELIFLIDFLTAATKRLPRGLDPCVSSTYHSGEIPRSEGRAREENRTPDLRITSALLCRLSYSGGTDHISSGHRKSRMGCSP